MDESPFLHRAEMQDIESLSESQKYWRFFVRKTKVMFLRVIPFLDDVHPDYLIPLSIVISVAMGVIFISLFVTSYYETLNTQYLSPVSGADSKYCDPISTTITGDFLGTETGLWEGSAGFEYAESAYTVSVTSFDTTFAEYSLLMNEVYTSLVGIGQLAETQDLAQNLVYWMSMVFIVPFSNAQRFFLNGTPLTIFDRQNTGGSISSVNGTCNASSTANFDSSTGLMVLNYNYQEYVNNPICMSSANPNIMGYMKGINSDYFTLKVDVRTLITSLAINMNITKLSDVVEIPGYAGNYTYNGVTYNISNYYDPKYPGMAPLTCLNGAISQCILAIGSVYALPLFNHAGANFSYPTVCDCSELSEAYLNDKYAPCNTFAFLSGILFWENTLPNAIFDIASSFNFEYSLINKAAYNASFAASFFGSTSPAVVALDTPEYRNSSYAFCNLPGYGPCSLLTFSSFDYIMDNWAISSYYYQLQNGACRNTFYTNEQDWQSLIDTPFAPLTQQYEQCNYSPKVTFIQVAGITMGNIYLLLPFCALFFVILFQAYKTCCGGAHENLYTEFEVKQAMKTLSTALLLARDNKVPSTVDGARSRTVSGVTASHRNTNIDSLVLKLAAELEDLTEAFKNQKHSAAVAATTTTAVPVSPNTLQSSLIAQDSMAKTENGSSDVVRISASNSVDNTPQSAMEERNSNNIAVSPIHRL